MRLVDHFAITGLAVCELVPDVNPVTSNPRELECPLTAAGHADNASSSAMPRKFRKVPKVLTAKAKRGTVTCTNGGHVEIGLPAIRIPVSTGGGEHVGVLASSTPLSFHYIAPVRP